MSEQFNADEYFTQHVIDVAEPMQMELPMGLRCVIKRGSEQVYDSEDAYALTFASASEAKAHGREWVEAEVRRMGRVHEIRSRRQEQLPAKLRAGSDEIEGLKAERSRISKSIKGMEKAHYRWTLETDEPGVKLEWTGQRFAVRDEPSCFDGDLDGEGKPLDGQAATAANSVPVDREDTRAVWETVGAGGRDLKPDNSPSVPAPGEVSPAGSVCVDRLLLESRPWARTTVASLLRAEKARAKPRRKVLDLLEDHPFSADAGIHDAAAVLFLTSQQVTPLAALVECVGQLRDIEVVREAMTRENARRGTTKPREVVIEACERALERLMEQEGGNVH